MKLFLHFICAAVVALSSLSLAQEELSEFLAKLETNPGIRASRALVNASQTQLDAVYFPISGELTGGYNRQFIFRKFE